MHGKQRKDTFRYIPKNVYHILNSHILVEITQKSMETTRDNSELHNSNQ